MPYRKVLIKTQGIYHICTKSIAGYTIFNNTKEFQRMVSLLGYYQYASTSHKFGEVMKMTNLQRHALMESLKETNKKVVIIAYCIMPTHLHLLLRQTAPDGIENFMRISLNSYSKYFNFCHKRKGPLWEGPFKAIAVRTDEQILHLTRYIHLNPTTAYLVERPENWEFSSYTEYLGKTNGESKRCDYTGLLDIDISHYEAFVNDHIGYQRALAKLKKLTLE